MISPDDSSHKKLNTPLASVLPPELADVNVNDVFPDFKPDVVLRFSRLFGPGRPSSLPKRWTAQRKNGDVEQTEDVMEDDDDEVALEKILAEEWPTETPESQTRTGN